MAWSISGFRFVFAGLSSVGMAIIYGLKVNLSVAIVFMVDNNDSSKEKEENQLNNETLDSVSGLVCSVDKDDTGIVAFGEQVIITLLYSMCRGDAMKY